MCHLTSQPLLRQRSSGTARRKQRVGKELDTGDSVVSFQVQFANPGNNREKQLGCSNSPTLLHNSHDDPFNSRNIKWISLHTNDKFKKKGQCSHNPNKSKVASVHTRLSIRLAFECSLQKPCIQDALYAILLCRTDWDCSACGRIKNTKPRTAAVW